MSPAPGAAAAADARRPRDRPGADHAAGRPEVDRAFLEYYEEELAHIRALAAEFADLHPAVARNLVARHRALPRPLRRAAARGRRLPRGAHPAEARRRGRALRPGGARRALSRPGRADAGGRHGGAAAGAAGADDARRPRRAARHPAGRRPAAGPLDARHLHDRAGRDALAGRDRRASPTCRTAARWPPPGSAPVGGAPRRGGAAADAARGPAPGALAELALDRLDLHFRNRAKAPALFDALFGAGRGGRARAGRGAASRCGRSRGPSMVGLRRRRGADAAHPRRLRGLPAAARVLHDAGAVPLRPGRRAAAGGGAVAGRSSRSSSCCAGRRRSSPTCGRRTCSSSRRR